MLSQSKHQWRFQFLPSIFRLLSGYFWGLNWFAVGCKMESLTLLNESDEKIKQLFLSNCFNSFWIAWPWAELNCFKYLREKKGCLKGWEYKQFFFPFVVIYIHYKIIRVDKKIQLSVANLGIVFRIALHLQIKFMTTFAGKSIYFSWLCHL